MGLSSTDELKPWQIVTRVNPVENKHFGELFNFVDDGCFSRGEIPSGYERAYTTSSAESFHAI